MTYRLTRICPDGVTRRTVGLKDRGHVEQAAFFVLWEKGAEFNIIEDAAFRVSHAPLGDQITTHGYTFIVTKETES